MNRKSNEPTDDYGTLRDYETIQIIIPPKPGEEEDYYDEGSDATTNPNPTTTTRYLDICSSSMSSSLQLHETDLPSSKLPFTWKLYEMLENVEKNGQDHIISWVNNGTGFRVHDYDGFVNEIIPIYFKQTKYKSFQRQLYFYNFKRESAASSAAAAGGSTYSHPKFIRGKKQLCLTMTPKKSTKCSATKKSKKGGGQEKLLYVLIVSHLLQQFLLMIRHQGESHLKMIMLLLILSVITILC